MQREKKKRNSIFPSSKIWENTFFSYGQGTRGGRERVSLASVGDRLDPRPTGILIRLAIANIGLPKKQTEFMVAWPFEKQENFFVKNIVKSHSFPTATYENLIHPLTPMFPPPHRMLRHLASPPTILPLEKVRESLPHCCIDLLRGSQPRRKGVWYVTKGGGIGVVGDFFSQISPFFWHRRCCHYPPPSAPPPPYGLLLHLPWWRRNRLLENKKNGDNFHAVKMSGKRCTLRPSQMLVSLQKFLFY